MAWYIKVVDGAALEHIQSTSTPEASASPSLEHLQVRSSVLQITTENYIHNKLTNQVEN